MSPACWVFFASTTDAANSVLRESSRILFMRKPSFLEHWSKSLQEYHLLRLRESRRNQPVEIHSAGRGCTATVPPVPCHRVRSGVARLGCERAHQPSADVVHGNTDVALRGKRKRDRRLRIERIGIVLGQPRYRDSVIGPRNRG